MSSESIVWILSMMLLRVELPFSGQRVKTLYKIDFLAILFLDWRRFKLDVNMLLRSCFSSISITRFKLRSDHTHFSVSFSLLDDTFLMRNLKHSSKLYAMLTHSTSWCEYLRRFWMWLLYEKSELSFDSLLWVLMMAWRLSVKGLIKD